MHRTRTTTTLLLGLAVSAVSGCVSVDPAPSTFPVRHEPRLTREDEPKLVQAPAREALDSAPKSPEPRKAPAPDSVTSRPAAPPPEPTSAPVRPRPPGTETPDGTTRTPRRVLPSLPVETVDVCALGRQYGGWRADSQESRICRDAYGN
ncbi:hypothetical protein [Streptomyces sp. SYSU K217416]